MPRIVRFHRTGGAEVLALEDVPLQPPGEGEVRLKVEAIGLNRAEVMFRMGQYLENPSPPSRIGYEASGTIDAIGTGVEGFAVGERVSTIPSFSMQRYGVYGESAIVPATALARYPAALSAAEAAAIWMQYLTAWGALVHYATVGQGDAVLITAASSSVGLAAIQIVKSLGAAAIASTRTAGKRQSLLDAGADHVIVTDDEDLVERVMAITAGKGAPVVFDPVAGPMLETLARAAAPGGTIIEYGALAMAPTPYPLFTALQKGLVVRGYTLFEIVSDAELRAAAVQWVNDGIASGALKPLIDRTFPLEEIVEAHRYMESNQQLGKIVVTV